MLELETLAYEIYFFVGDVFVAHEADLLGELLEDLEVLDLPLAGGYLQSLHYVFSGGPVLRVQLLSACASGACQLTAASFLLHNKIYCNFICKIYNLHHGVLGFWGFGPLEGTCSAS